jgi:TadE-like protein
MPEDRKSENRPSRGPRLWRTEGTQIVELAVTLPLLVVIVVGIFDFGGAYHLKQNLNGAAREAARFASSLPTSDLGGSPPDSITSMRNMVDAYLRAAGINDCGLSTKTPAPGGTSLEWVYTATGGGCPTGGLTLDIERSFAYTATGTGASKNLNVISTRVTITYAYKWQFGKVVDLLAQGANYAKGVTQLKTVAVVPNMD